MGLSAKITVFLISQKIISAKDRDVYEYGFDLLIADCINFSLILLIGILWSQLKETVIYLIIFVGLRSVCGGYHAKTHCKCHICTIGAYIFFLFLQYILQDHITMSLLGDCIAAVPIILFAPITHANKPLSKQISAKPDCINCIYYRIDNPCIDTIYFSISRKYHNFFDALDCVLMHDPGNKCSFT